MADCRPTDVEILCEECIFSAEHIEKLDVWDGAMLVRVLYFSFIVVFARLLVSCGSNCVNTVDKPLHQIVDSVLLKQIERFDSTYGEYPQAYGRGICISYTQYSDSIHFGIRYAAGINSNFPLLLCEPVNGKPVYIDIYDLYDFVNLPEQQAVELKREFCPSEYEMHIEAMSDSITIDGEIYVGCVEVMNDFVSWKVKLDKNKNLICVDTLGFRP